MKITGLSHLFKWENLHNWWLTKYFFAPLYIRYVQSISSYFVIMNVGNNIAIVVCICGDILQRFTLSAVRESRGAAAVLCYATCTRRNSYAFISNKQGVFNLRETRTSANITDRKT